MNEGLPLSLQRVFKCQLFKHLCLWGVNRFSCCTTLTVQASEVCNTWYYRGFVNLTNFYHGNCIQFIVKEHRKWWHKYFLYWHSYKALFDGRHLFWHVLILYSFIQIKHRRDPFNQTQQSMSILTRRILNSDGKNHNNIFLWFEADFLLSKGALQISDSQFLYNSSTIDFLPFNNHPQRYWCQVYILVYNLFSTKLRGMIYERWGLCWHSTLLPHPDITHAKSSTVHAHKTHLDNFIFSYAFLHDFIKLASQKTLVQK